MIIVRPLAMRRRLALTSASLSGSSALVASSKMRSARIGDEGARDRKTLALAARQVGRAFLDPGLVTARQPLDELLGTGKAGRAHRVLERQAGSAGDDVVAHRAAKQEIVLHAPPRSCGADASD